MARKLRLARPGATALNRALIAAARRLSPELIIVVKGAFLDPATLERVKAETGAVLVNYATDDPFNPRVSTPQLRQSIGLFDLYLCTKRAIMDDISRAGARQVGYVRFGYKPAVHFPEHPATADEAKRFRADVAFIGGCDEDRTPYFEALIKALPEIRLALYGGYWHRVRSLRRFWRGIALGRDYRLAISSASVVVNLVRRANRDDHVMRTFEVPACSGRMLAERTPEHEILLADGRAAIFDGVDDFVSEVARVLYSPGRDSLGDLARAWVTAGGHSYRHRLEEVVVAALGSVP